MAEGSSRSGIPNDLDIILFAEDFINHVMVQKSQNYTIEKSSVPFRETVERHFNETIKRAIFIIESGLEGNSMADYYQMFDDFEVSEYDFARIADMLVKGVIARGFSGNKVLTYFAHISSLASSFYEHGLPSAPLLAESRVIHYLQTHLPYNGWKYIHRAAERYGNISEVNEPSTATRKSNEIELLNQTEDEASAEKSGIASQSSKQNVSSENERSIEQQKLKTVCQKYETPPNILYFSGSSSAMGLSPLKEYKPSKIESSIFSSERNEITEMSELKDDTRRDESSIDNEPVLIRSAYKEKMDEFLTETKSDDPQTVGLEENLTNKAILDDKFKSGPSSAFQTPVLLDENNSGKNSLSFTTKAGSDSPANPSFEENKLIDNSSKDGFHTGTSDFLQSSSFSENKFDVVSYQKIGEKYRSVTSEDDLVGKPEQDEKLISETPNAKEIGANSAEIEPNLPAVEGNNTYSETAPLTDQESPQLDASKDL